MQGVIEFVEKGGGIIPGYQRGFSRCRIDEVGIDGSQNSLSLAIHIRVAAIHGSPGAGAFSCAGIGIQIPEADVVARFIGNFPYLYILVKYRDRSGRYWFKIISKDLFCCIE